MLYRGYKIEKFYSAHVVPRHIIREYYQSEKTKIDRMIKSEETRKKSIEDGFIPENITETISDIINEWYQ